VPLSLNQIALVMYAPTTEAYR